MGRGGTPAREISFVSLVAYGPNSDSALTMGGYSLWNQAGRFPTVYAMTLQPTEPPDQDDSAIVFLDSHLGGPTAFSILSTPEHDSAPTSLQLLVKCWLLDMII